MALNYVTLTVDLGGGQGYYLSSGIASFVPTAVLTDAADHLMVSQVPLSVEFGEQGAPVIRLLATDNVNLSPSGWAWTITPPAGSGIAPFSFFLPFSGGAAQYLSALAPVSPVVAMQAYMPLPSGTAVAGQAPLATGSGGASAWGSLVAGVTATDTSIVVSGTSQAPTIATGTLDVIAARHAPAADWSNNSHKITSLANGTATADAAAYGQLLAAEPSWLPSDAGFLAWTYDPVAATGTFTMVSGTVYLFRVNIRAALSCTNVISIIGTAGSGLTSGQNFAGLYSSAGTKIGITADQTTPWATAGLQTMALAGGPFALSAGFYWVAMLAVGTTPPVVLSATGTFRASNAGTAVSVARYATNGTGATALPASITPGSNSLLSPAVWAAIS